MQLHVDSEEAEAQLLDDDAQGSVRIHGDSVRVDGRVTDAQVQVGGQT